MKAFVHQATLITLGYNAESYIHENVATYMKMHRLLWVTQVTWTTYKCTVLCGANQGQGYIRATHEVTGLQKATLVI